MAGPCAGCSQGKEFQSKAARSGASFGKRVGVGMRMVSKVFWMEVSGTCIFHEVGEKEKMKSSRFPAEYTTNPRPHGGQGEKESVSRSLWVGSSQGKQMAREAIWGKSRREGP